MAVRLLLVVGVRSTTAAASAVGVSATGPRTPPGSGLLPMEPARVSWRILRTVLEILPSLRSGAWRRMVVFGLWMLLGFLGGPVDLLQLAGAPAGPGAPTGWQVQSVRGVEPPLLEITALEPERTFRLSGAGRAAWVFRDLRQAPPTPGSTLSWSWRVLEAPPASDLRDPSLDDSPIRVYVVFGNPRALLGRSGKIIFYSFGNAEPPGYAAPSHVSKDRIHVIRVDGAGEVGRWRGHMTTPDADYRRIWGRSPPAISAIGVMQDTDQTGALAVAELRLLTIDPPGQDLGSPPEGDC